VVKLDTLRGTLGRAIDAEIMKLESHVGILSTVFRAGRSSDCSEAPGV